jgi:hypothetical protein
VVNCTLNEYWQVRHKLRHFTLMAIASIVLLLCMKRIVHIVKMHASLSDGKKINPQQSQCAEPGFAKQEKSWAGTISVMNIGADLEQRMFRKQCREGLQMR